MCAPWSCSAAMFHYPPGCVRILAATGWLVKARAMSGKCHSLYNLLTDDPVGLRRWRASESRVSRPRSLVSARLQTASRAARRPSKRKALKINLAFAHSGRGILGFCVLILNDQKMFTSVLEMFFNSQ